MVELIEYIIVFGVSVGLAGASVMIVNQAMPGLEEVAAASAADQVSGAARIAVVEDRNVTLVLPLQNSTIACSGGSLSVALAGGSPRAYEIGFPCSFDYQGLDGDCTLSFSAPTESLQLAVAC